MRIPSSWSWELCLVRVLAILQRLTRIDVLLARTACLDGPPDIGLDVGYKLCGDGAADSVLLVRVGLEVSVQGIELLGDCQLIRRDQGLVILTVA